MKEYLRSDKAKSESGLSDNLKRITTSAFMLILAFMVSNLVLQTTIAILSKSFKYSVQMTYNHVSSLPTDYHRWSLARILAVYLTAPTFCLGLGLFIFILLTANPNWINKMRLFVFWLMVCLVNIFLSHFIFAPLGIRAASHNFYQTFAIVGTWLYLAPEVMTVFSVLSIIVSFIWGLLITSELLRFSFSNRRIKTTAGKNRLTFQLYLVPVILAALPLLLLSTAANIIPSLIMIMNLALFGFGMFLMNSSRRIKLKVDKSDVLNSVPVLEVAVCTLVWLAIYIFFR